MNNTIIESPRQLKVNLMHCVVCFVFHFLFVCLCFLLIVC